MGRYSPFNINNIRKRYKEKKFEQKTGRPMVKPQQVPLTGMTHINQSKQYARAQNQEIMREAKDAAKSTAQWRNPAAVFELRATFFNCGNVSLYKAPVVFGNVSQWKERDGVSYMACSATTVILATSPETLYHYLEEYGDRLGICVRSTEHEQTVVPIRVAGGTFRATTDHMKCGVYVNWIAAAAKALAINSLALAAPTNMPQDLAAIGRTGASLVDDAGKANGGKSKDGKISKKAATELMAQRLRDHQLGGHTLGGCRIAMGIAFSHFDGNSIGADEYYTFADLHDNDAVVDAINDAHTQLMQELSEL